MRVLNLLRRLIRTDPPPPRRTSRGPSSALSGPPRPTEATLPRAAAPEAPRGSAVTPPPHAWRPAGATTTVAGRAIPGGLLYIGSRLDAVAGAIGPEPALIRPELPIDWSNPNMSGSGMNYWPSYSEIAPGSRAAYLQWLIGGRLDPTTYIGYVFLFFYGLERRALHELEGGDGGSGELNSIRAEARRLLALYGDNNSFRAYASSFVAYLDTPRIPERLYAGSPPVDLRDTDLPFMFRVGLGQAARDGAPLPWTWALAWYRMTSRSRAPVERCPDEFNELFRIRYAEHHGVGITLRDARSRLRVEHHPASASFRGRTFHRDVGVADVAAMASPLQKVTEIGDRCCDELAPYARLLARDPDAASSLVGLARLPPDLDGLAAGPTGPRFEALVDRVRSSGSAPVLLDADELISLWPADDPSSLRKPEAVLIAQLFARQGVGIEPDVRFGGRPIRSGSRAVLFALSDDRSDAPSLAYHAGTLLLTLTAALAAADSDISAAEERVLAAHIEESLHLSPSEKVRLRAHLLLVLADPPKLTRIDRKLKALDQPQRQAIGRFLVRVATADGRVDASEMKVLARAFRLLSLDPGSVHAEIHAVTTGVPAADAVRVRAAAPQAGYSIPPARPTEASSPFVLDAAAINAKLRETMQVSALLDGVLGDDDATTAPTPQPASEVLRSEPAGHSPGLDEAHARLLVALVQRDQWPWDDVKALADDLGLMPSGALERINEVALQRLASPVLESGDPTWIDRTVAQELMS